MEDISPEYDVVVMGTGMAFYPTATLLSLFVLQLTDFQPSRFDGMCAFRVNTRPSRSNTIYI